MRSHCNPLTDTSNDVSSFASPTAPPSILIPFKPLVSMILSHLLTAHNAHFLKDERLIAKSHGKIVTTLNQSRQYHNFPHLCQNLSISLTKYAVETPLFLAFCAPGGRNESRIKVRLSKHDRALWCVGRNRGLNNNDANELAKARS